MKTLKYLFISLIAIACSEDPELPGQSQANNLEAMKGRVVGSWSMQSVTLVSTLSETIVGEDSMTFTVPRLEPFQVYRVDYVFEKGNRAQMRIPKDHEVSFITYQVYEIREGSYGIRTSSGNVFEILDGSGFLSMTETKQLLGTDRYLLQYLYTKDTD